MRRGFEPPSESCEYKKTSKIGPPTRVRQQSLAYSLFDLFLQLNITNPFHTSTRGRAQRLKALVCRCRVFYNGSQEGHPELVRSSSAFYATQHWNYLRYYRLFSSASTCVAPDVSLYDQLFANSLQPIQLAKSVPLRSWTRHPSSAFAVRISLACSQVIVFELFITA